MAKDGSAAGEKRQNGSRTVVEKDFDHGSHSHQPTQSEREAIRLADDLRQRFGPDAPTSAALRGLAEMLSDAPAFVSQFDRVVCAAIREARERDR